MREAGAYLSRKGLRLGERQEREASHLKAEVFGFPDLGGKWELDAVRPEAPGANLSFPICLLWVVACHQPSGNSDPVKWGVPILQGIVAPIYWSLTICQRVLVAYIISLMPNSHAAGQLLYKGENGGWEGWVPCTEQCKWFSKSTSIWPESPLSWPQYPSKTLIKPCQAHGGHDAKVTCSLGFTANTRNASQARCLCANAHWPLRKTTTNRKGTETPLAFKTETAPCSVFLDGLVHFSISAFLSPHPPHLYVIRKVNLCPKVGHMFLSLLPGSREEGTSVCMTPNGMLQLKNLRLPFSTCTWKRKPKHTWGWHNYSILNLCVQQLSLMVAFRDKIIYREGFGLFLFSRLVNRDDVCFPDFSHKRGSNKTTHVQVLWKSTSQYTKAYYYGKLSAWSLEQFHLTEYVGGCMNLALSIRKHMGLIKWSLFFKVCGPWLTETLLFYKHWPWF